MSKSSKATQTSKTILVVDDETDLREALATAFTYEGFLTLTAPDGEEGLNSALKNKPDIILLDVMMPKMNGLEMLKKLREDEWGKSVRVIVMTAFDNLSQWSDAVDIGIEEYVMKTDVTLSSIVAKVKDKLNAVVEK